MKPHQIYNVTLSSYLIGVVAVFKAGIIVSAALRCIVVRVSCSPRQTASLWVVGLVWTR